MSESDGTRIREPQKQVDDTVVQAVKRTVKYSKEDSSSIGIRSIKNGALVIKPSYIYRNRRL